MTKEPEAVDEVDAKLEYHHGYHVQEEGLCRADQSVPPAGAAGVGWGACHIVYQGCNGRGGRVFWFGRW